MDKSQCKEHARYMVTLRDEGGRLRPENLYVYRCYDDFMVVRFLDRDGFVHKLRYGDVVKVVKVMEVPPKKRYLLPEALLAKEQWQDKEVLHIYATSPGLGK
ncbi:MAG: hypothetical protein D6819_10840 [Gammaproteobacteria bacterium]|nr:MAG: hypothetical protein D6819_10840 [Gammaproteobacteria bacterium]